MPLDLLVAEAEGMTDDAIMEVVRFMKFIKIEQRSSSVYAPHKPEKRLREAGYFKNTGKGWMTDDFDEPLDDFEEYMP